MGHHPHMRVEASDKDVPVVPCESGDSPNKKTVVDPCIKSSVCGGLEDGTMSHWVPCGVDFDKWVTSCGCGSSVEFDL